MPLKRSFKQHTGFVDRCSLDDQSLKVQSPVEPEPVVASVLSGCSGPDCNAQLGTTLQKASRLRLEPTESGLFPSSNC